MTAWELNLDGLVGPTHNYAGLAHGNLASQQHRHATSNPRQAALEGLDKMMLLARRGIKQAVLPPQLRPDIATLRRLGFIGSDADVLNTAAKNAPELLAASSSASAMWAANAATVSPGADTADHRVHMTAANLAFHLHRAIEAPATAATLRVIFPEGPHFTHHDPLPATMETCDEGAANHMRLCADHGQPGLEIFVYGREPGTASGRFTARHTRHASESVVRLHQLDPDRMLLLQQNPAAIDAGVFHNDVVAVANGPVLLCHELAWERGQDSIQRIERQFAAICSATLHCIIVPNDLLPLEQAVASYLFNSQLVTLPDGGILLLAPEECRQIPAARAAVDFVQKNCAAIREVQYVDVRQSMHNGGGPACLRLRVVLTDDQLAAMHQGVLLTEQLYKSLRQWIERHYRDHLTPPDLADQRLLAESRTAQTELADLLGIPAVLPA